MSVVFVFKSVIEILIFDSKEGFFFIFGKVGVKVGVGCVFFF